MKFAHVPAIAAAVLVAGVGCSTARVYKVQEGLRKEGIPYALPITVVEAKVTVAKETKKPGVFMQFAKADEFKIPLGYSDDDVIEMKKDSYKISATELNTRAEADPKEVYLVELADNPFRSQKVTMNLNQYGVITGGSIESTDRTLEFAVKAAQVAAGLVKTSAVGGAMAHAPVNPDLQRAREARDAILGLREKRIILITGTSGTSGLSKETLTVMLEAIDKEEKALLSMFVGSVSVKTWDALYAIRPDAPGRTPLFYLDPDHGVHLATQPEYPVAKGFGNPNADSDATHLIALSLVSDANRQIAPVIAQLKPVKSHRSFYYRIPAEVDASIESGGKKTKGQAIRVAQFGVTASLPTTILSKSTTYTVKWYDQTGSLQEVTADVKGHDPAIVDEIGKAAQDLVKANDPLLRLNRENAILEAEQKNRELKKKEIEELQKLLEDLRTRFEDATEDLTNVIGAGN